MGISASDLHNFDCLEQVDQSRCRLIWITLNISGQVFHRWQTELTASASAPRVNIPLYIDSNCVSVSPSNLVDALVSQLLDF